MSEIKIRMAVPEDAGELLEIYRPYVEDTAVSFEYVVPSLEEFEGRIRKVLTKFPYLVAELDGKLVGYAYASSFHVREAYEWCVETSIYVRKGWSGKGCGKALYQELERMLKKQNILNLNACIAYKEEEDEYLTHQSKDFHAHMGYRLVGEFHECGYKFGRWYSMIWMEKMLGAHDTQPKKVVSITQF